jgi:hypothetical protein
MAAIFKAGTLLLVLMFAISFAVESISADPYWQQFMFDSKGVYQFKGVTHIPGNGASRICSLTTNPGSVQCLCSNTVDGAETSGSSAIRWSSLPGSGKENESINLNVDMTNSQSEHFLGFMSSKMIIDGQSGACGSFQDAGTPFTLGRATIANNDLGEKPDVLKYRFPTFYTPWICMGLMKEEDNVGTAGEMMRREALKAGVYFINFTITTYTECGDDTYVYEYEWVPGGEKGGDISGRITDGYGDPMPYMNVSLDFLGKRYDTLTDAAGSYEIDNIVGFSPNTDNPPEGTLTAYFTYWRDGKNYFSVFDRTRGDALVTMDKKFKLADDSEKRQDMDFMLPLSTSTSTLKGTDADAAKVPWLKKDDELSSPVVLRNLKHTAPIYYYISNAVDFDLTILKADIDYKLPVEVFVGGSTGTLYSRPTSLIQINITDSQYKSSNRPRNREYHEFSHHLLFSQWNGTGLRGANDTNHDGFLNDDTGDSYTEGFAEFMACVIADYTPNPNDPAPPDDYAGFTSLNEKRKVWDWNGKNEELSIAGVLWDIYKKDGISIQNLWPVLKEKRANFLEYAKALKAAFPAKAAAIDQSLIEHGFFADNYTGNGVRDAFEPFRDANQNGIYDAGEYFIDYGITVNRTNITWDGFGEVGRATNYQRPDRGQAVELPGAFVKAADSGSGLMDISIHHDNPADGADYTLLGEMRGGLVYVMPLPEDVPGSITVTPHGGGGIPYTITSAEYKKKYYSRPAGQGYFDTHDFGPITPEEGFDGVEPAWGSDSGTDVVDTSTGKYPSGGPGGLGSIPDLSGTCPCASGLILLLVLSFAYRKA